MTIFERVKETANLRKINLQTLAEKSGMGINSIYGWKTKTPSVEKISAVADVLHVSTDYLLGRTDEMNVLSNKTESESSRFDEEIMMAFDGKPIPDEDKEKLLEFARFLRSQRGK